MYSISRFYILINYGIDQNILNNRISYQQCHLIDIWFANATNMYARRRHTRRVASVSHEVLEFVLKQSIVASVKTSA